MHVLSLLKHAYSFALHANESYYLGAHLLAEDDNGCDNNDDTLDVVADRVSDGRHGIKSKESSLVVELQYTMQSVMFAWCISNRYCE